jgi:hypothetical protein
LDWSVGVWEEGGGERGLMLVVLSVVMVVIRTQDDAGSGPYDGVD